jgi:hypothetical protein
VLRVGHRPRLERIEVQPNRRQWRFQLVGDRVDEGVVLLVALDFEHEEHGVNDDAGNDQGEKQDPGDEGDERQLGEDEPIDIEKDRRPDKQDAECDEEADRLLATGHGGILRRKCRIQNAEFRMEFRSSCSRSV